MKILALEFSSDQRSAAVLERDAVPPAAAPALSASVLTDLNAAGVAMTPAGYANQTGARGMKAIQLIEAALALAGWDRRDIECLAIGLGPGSYTGIRSAIAVAQGWHFARPIKLLGLSSADCLAAQATGLGCRGRLCVLLDAQRNEFYLGSYDFGDVQCKMSEPLRLTTMDEARAAVARGDLVIGPEVNRWFPEGRVLFPNAAMLAQLAAGRSDFVAPEKLEPIYLRKTAFVKAPPPRSWPEEPGGRKRTFG